MSLNALSGPRIKQLTEAGAPYETIRIDKLTPMIGAEISGVDLGEPLSNRQKDEIHRALAENLRDLLPRPADHARSSTWLSAASSASCTCIRRRRTSPAIPS